LLNKQRLGDARRQLWWHFMEAAERAETKVIVMENVPQLLGSLESERMLRHLHELGYKYLMAHVLCTANYGVPQVRHRAIIMASKVGPIALPTPTHFSRVQRERLDGKAKLLGLTLHPWVPVRDVIGDLDVPMGTEIRRNVGATNSLHFGRKPTDRSIERYQAVPPGGNRFDLLRNRRDLTPDCWIKKTSGGTDLFGRLWWDRPSVTIRTEFFKPEKGRYLHPEAHRPITHREAARIQTFPDGFHFVGSKIEIAKQIGNAVPPLLAFAIARRVRECLENQTTVEDMEHTCAVFTSALGERLRHVWFDEPSLLLAGA
jgi:DNA (cytosine-5)-methyltransferase 1